MFKPAGATAHAVLFALSTLASAATPLNAYAMTVPGRHGPAKMQAMMHANPLPNLMRAVVMHEDALNLPPEQDQALAVWRKQNHPKAQALVPGIRNFEAALMQQASLAGVPKAELQKKLASIFDLRRKLADQKTDCRDTMRKVLSKEQFGKVVSLYRAMDQRAATKGASAGASKISATGAWTRKPLTSNGNSAAYLTLQNDSRSDDKLVAVRSDAVEKPELHTHTMENGVMKMRQVEGGIPLPAGAKTELKPGGYHIMLIGLKRKLEVGDKLPLTLVFEKGEMLKLEVPVVAKPPASAHRGSHH